MPLNLDSLYIISLCEKNSIELDAGHPGYTYQWSTGQTTQKINPTAAGIYSVFLQIGACGLNDTSEVQIDNANPALFIPTAFSPNGDNQNDMYYIMSGCLKDVEFTIFDRWGNKVFETTDLSHGWDGKCDGNLLNTSVFVYNFKAMSEAGNPVRASGTIALMR